MRARRSKSKGSTSMPHQAILAPSAFSPSLPAPSLCSIPLDRRGSTAHCTYLHLLLEMLYHLIASHCIRSHTHAPTPIHTLFLVSLLSPPPYPSLELPLPRSRIQQSSLALEMLAVLLWIASRCSFSLALALPRSPSTSSPTPLFLSPVPRSPRQRITLHLAMFTLTITLGIVLLPQRLLNFCLLLAYLLVSLYRPPTALRASWPQ